MCPSVCFILNQVTGDLFWETMLCIWMKVGMMVKCYESLKMYSLHVRDPTPRSQGYFEKVLKTVFLFSLQDCCLHLTQTCLKVWWLLELEISGLIDDLGYRVTFLCGHSLMWVLCVFQEAWLSQSQQLNPMNFNSLAQIRRGYGWDNVDACYAMFHLFILN